MGALRDRMIEEMKLRNFSTATQESYLYYAVSRLARYHHKSPDQLSKEDSRAFLEWPVSDLPKSSNCRARLKLHGVVMKKMKLNMWNKGNRSSGVDRQVRRRARMPIQLGIRVMWGIRIRKLRPFAVARVFLRSFA
jgi:hypothetical protein